MADLAELQSLLKEADARGDRDGALRLMDAIESAPSQEPTAPRNETATDIFNRIKSDASNKKTFDKISDIPDTKASQIMSVIPDAVSEVPAAIASTLAGQFPSGVMQLTDYLLPGSVDNARERGYEIEAKATAYGAPQTYGGKSAMELLGTGAQFLGDEFNQTVGGLTSIFDEQTGQDMQRDGVFPVIARKTMDATNSPAFSALVESIPEIFGAAIPITKIAQTRGSQTLPKQELADRIESGDEAGDLAKYKLDSRGKLKPDLTAQDALDMGMDPGVVQQFKALPQPEGVGVLKGEPKMNPTRKKALRMLQIKKNGIGDSVYRNKNRPADIVGESGLDRLNYVKDINRKAGKAIDLEANKLKLERVDFSQPMDSFNESLKSMGVNFDFDDFARRRIGDPEAKPNIDFGGTDIEDIPTMERAITNIVSRLGRGTKGQMPTAYDVHRLKRYLDNNINYNKTSDGLTADVESVMRQLRSDMDGVLDAKFPDYDKANIAYAETIGMIKEMQSLAGSKVDLKGQYANRAVGQTLRKALTNYQSGSRVRSVLSDMDQVSRKYGASFGDDIDVLISLDNDLDKMFGSSADGGLQATIASGSKNTFNDITDNRSFRSKAADYAIKRITPKQKDAFDVMERMLRGDESPWRD